MAFPDLPVVFVSTVVSSLQDISHPIVAPPSHLLFQLKVNLLSVCLLVIIPQELFIS